MEYRRGRMTESIAEGGAKQLCCRLPCALANGLIKMPGLCLAYRVAQVGNADARNHRRVPKEGRRAGEVIEESHSGAKKNRHDIDADFVEESSVQELLDRVCAVHP